MRKLLLIVLSLITLASFGQRNRVLYDAPRYKVLDTSTVTPTLGRVNFGTDTALYIGNGTAWERLSLQSNLGGGSSVAGSNTEIQYNDNGALGSSSNLTYDGTTLSLSGDSYFENGEHRFRSSGAGDGGIRIETMINGFTSINWVSNNVGLSLISGGGIAARVLGTVGFTIGDGLSIPSLGARFGVIGSGSTSSTVNQLNENSSGEELFKVTDDGEITFHNGFVFNTEGSAARIFTTVSGGMMFQNNSGSLQLRSAGSQNLSVFSSGGVDIQNAASPNTVPSLELVPRSTQLAPLLKAVSTIIQGDGDISIGNLTPNPSAALEITSTTKGFLPPRMSNAEMNAIAGPEPGMIVYDLTNNVMMYFNGTSWQPF